MTDLSKLDAFTRAYLEAALWSSNDESDPDTGGDPLDKNYGPEDIAPDTLAVMVADCVKFQYEQAKLIREGSEGLRGNYPADEHAGHDFWLTRNGHGCGFWDGDWPKPYGDLLSAACKAYKTFNLYVGDDGGIHGS